MESQTENKAAGTPAPEPLPATLAGDGNARPETPLDNPPVHASATIVDFGGLRGGQARKDGLIPGSDEAKEADKLYDRVRKWRRNHPPSEPHPEEHKLPDYMRQGITRDMDRIKAAEDRERTRPRPAYLRKPGTAGTPPPLPSMAPAPETARVETSDVQSLADAAAAALDRWNGTDVEPVLTEFVKLLQDLIKLKREREMALAKFPPEIARQIISESQWPERLEKRFCESAGRLVAKILNSANVPLQYKDELITATMALTILSIEIRTTFRISQMVADLKKNPPPK